MGATCPTLEGALYLTLITSNGVGKRFFMFRDSVTTLSSSEKRTVALLHEHEGGREFTGSSTPVHLQAYK